jgi:hypothetical protein
MRMLHNEAGFNSSVVQHLGRAIYKVPHLELCSIFQVECAEYLPALD